MNTEINGKPVAGLSATEERRMVSVTRSSGTQERSYEQQLTARGYQLKTRTTSQALDMVRACVDLSSITEPTLQSLGLFFRQRQKIWDGAAGLCFAYAAGLYVADGAGRARQQIDIRLDLADPVFDSTLIASDAVAAQVVVAASS